MIEEEIIRKKIKIRLKTRRYHKIGRKIDFFPINLADEGTSIIDANLHVAKGRRRFII